MRSRILALLTLVAATLLSVGTPSAATAPTQDITVDGQVRHPLNLTVHDLEKRYRQSLEFSTFSSGDGQQFHFFRGPLLRDVLAEAQPQFDPAIHNDELGFVVKITGSDGYVAVLSYAELDPKFAGKKILLATRQDQRVLARPRLVVPGDAAGARYVSDIVSVTVQHVN